MEHMQSMENENKTDMNQMVNYLLKNVISKKEKNENIVNDYMISEAKPVFLYEFFVFDLYVPKEILKTMKQPLLAFRFLDFPTLSIEGKVEEGKEVIAFNQGKNCFFEMELHQLKQYLSTEPLYIMFIDMNYGDIKIIATSRVNVSIFAFNQFLEYSGLNPPHPRRNILKLFDNVSSKVAEFDISLIIRREYFKYDSRKEVNINETLMNRNKDIYINDPFSNNNQMKPQSLDELLKGDKVNNIPRENTGKPLITRDQIMRELTVMKKETGTSTKEEYMANENLTKQKEENFLNPNSQNYIANLKSLLEGKGKNPPPLYFHQNKQRRSNNITVKVINETKEQSIINPSLLENTTQAGGVRCNSKTSTSVNKMNKTTELDKIKENVKMRESMQNRTKSNVSVDYVKKPSKNPKNSYIPPNNKPKGEKYENKMREVSRYPPSSKRERNNNPSVNSEEAYENSKQFIEDDDDNLQNNEYYNLFSKIKQNNNSSKNIQNKDNNSNKPSRGNTIESQAQSIHSKQSSLQKESRSTKSNARKEPDYKVDKEDDYNSKFYEKEQFYQISNSNQFELNGGLRNSQNELIRSYNSLSMSNSIPIEIRGAERVSFFSKKNNKVKFHDKDNSKPVDKTIESVDKKESIKDNTEGIEEDIYQSSQQFNYTNRSSSAKKKITEEEIMEDYDDFDYDHVDKSNSKFNNGVSVNEKEDSIIEEKFY